ncbi:hypothetical protein KIN20_006223 [Parelaphostrongylus tenuis]|uniref:Uncharacterized protein n=1 Tax=Parelaphostrongylus tenuis TaxID=148309 RepID=A0AAD5M3A7_PARTN|nr:hypothetical protein KIN20_006223 [Parelaphostrongylus tenuis]
MIALGVWWNWHIFTAREPVSCAGFILLVDLGLFSSSDSLGKVLPARSQRKTLTDGHPYCAFMVANKSAHFILSRRIQYVNYALLSCRITHSDRSSRKRCKEDYLGE